MEKLDFTKIRLLVLDVDGIMTDGKIYLGDNGDFFKSYNVLDGYGIVNAVKKGLEVAVITGGTSHSVLKRCEFLGIKRIYMGREDKVNVYNKEIKPLVKVDDSEVAFMGDDVFDIDLLDVVGYPITVPNAHELVKKRVKYITKRNGGDGAVREVIDLIFNV